MVAGMKRRGTKLAAALGLCAASWLSPHPASAELRHHLHHHIYHHAAYRPPAAEAPPPSAGFGPTYPGPSTLLMDASTGRVLSESGADIPRYPASLTKLMTLDLAFQALRDGKLTLDTPLPVSLHAASVEPVKLGLRPGSTITVRQAILAMTTMSANDAATALGEYLGGGSEARVAQMMTLRAHALGMAQTEFANASGLPNPNQVTTARDLAILARDIVVNDPDDQQFFEVESFNFEGRTIYSNNGMLKLYPGTTGMKTGYTDLARHNLVTSAERDGHVLIGVTLHEPSWGTSYDAMTAMLDSGFGGHIPGPNMAIAANQPAQAARLPAPAAPVRMAAARQRREAAPLALARNERLDESGGWTAQLGLYARMSLARFEALKAQHLHGVGIARVARVERHGRTLWTAQLAGLTFAAAHETCNALAARGASCHVIAPSTDHLAMRATPDRFAS